MANAASSVGITAMRKCAQDKQLLKRGQTLQKTLSFSGMMKLSEQLMHILMIPMKGMNCSCISSM
jgi:hypothetical protein